MEIKKFTRILLLLFIQYFNESVLSEFQASRLNRVVNTCSVKNRESNFHNNGSFLGEPSMMCDLRTTRNSCVFMANHRKGIGKGDDSYHELRCGVCPFNSTSICNQILEDGKERKTVCCCRSPWCLTNIYRDSEIGWKETDLSVDSGFSCLVANYDSRRVPRWKNESFEENRTLLEPCYISMNTSIFTDYRNGRNRSRVMLEMGYGCPFQMTSKDPQATFFNKTSVHCCKGVACNQELYREIYFEWIQNIVVRDEEKEFFRRLRSEVASFRNGRFADNPHHIHPKALFNLTFTHLVFITLIATFFILVFCPIKNIDQRPPVKHFVRKKKTMVVEDGKDDVRLVLGEF